MLCIKTLLPSFLSIFFIWSLKYVTNIYKYHLFLEYTLSFIIFSDSRNANVSTTTYSNLFLAYLLLLWFYEKKKFIRSCCRYMGSYSFTHLFSTSMYSRNEIIIIMKFYSLYNFILKKLNVRLPAYALSITDYGFILW